MAQPPLVIYLFGPLRVAVRGEAMPRVRTRSVEWLLALLALRHGRAVSRAWLAGTLWPESSDSQARKNLRDDLTRLRQALGPEGGRLQSPARDSLVLDLAGASVDVLQFDAAIQAGDEGSLRGAVQLYTGPLLEGCLEEWAFGERASRAEQCMAALETLAERAAGRGDHREAIRHLRQAEALDPLRDSLPRRLMASLAAAGDPAAAIQTYRDFRLRLQAELAAGPDEATTRLFHEIRAATRSTASRYPAAQRGLAPGPTLETQPAAPQTRSTGTLLTAGQAGSSRLLPEGLPRPLTSLIGREQELEEIREALRQGRLVTLVGGGGVGKTRLALELAIQAGDTFSGGAAWVELGPLTDGALVLPSVAMALGLRDQDGTSGADPDALARRLVARLSDGAPLLVMDNCEHLLDAAAAAVQMLLQSCPELRVLATSQQRLALPGEVVWRVPSLSVPGVEAFRPGTREADDGVEDRQEQPDVEFAGPERHHPLRGYPAERLNALMQFAAFRLFVERAAAVQPGFRLASAAEAEAVGQICRRLDGIPLALELAAARTRVLTPQQIAARLDDRFSLLTRGARGVLPRHQTLRALIDWSYDSLPDGEAALLRRLSVFAGGWTLEAAEAVCSDFGFRVPSGRSDFGLGQQGQRYSPAEPLAPDPSAIQDPNAQRAPEIQNHDVLDPLDSLVDRSLVLVDEAGIAPSDAGVNAGGRATGGGLRYRLLESVREYGREKLAGSGEWAAVRDRHRDWYLQLAEQAAPELSGPHRREWLAQLERENDNLRTALSWSVESRDTATALRLAGALEPFWRSSLHVTEGRQALAAALSLPAAEIQEPHRARALRAAGRLALIQGDLAAARTAWEAALAIWRRLQDLPAVAEQLEDLGSVEAGWFGEASAGAGLQESLAIWTQLGDRSRTAGVLTLMARLAVNGGALVEARGLFEEALTLNRGRQDLQAMADNLGHVGHLALIQGDHAAAGAYLEECLAIERSLGNRLSIGGAQFHLGRVAFHQGRYEDARAAWEETLAIDIEKMGHGGWVTVYLSELSAVQDPPQGAGPRIGQWVAAARREGGPTAALIRVLGDVAFLAGDELAARSHYEESLALFREENDLEEQLQCLFNLWRFERRRGDAPPGSLGSSTNSLRDEVLLLHEMATSRSLIARFLCCLGTMACGEGDPVAARRFLSESLEMYRAMQHRLGAVTCLLGWSALAVEKGESIRAARLCAAGAAHHPIAILSRPPMDRAEETAAVTALRAALGEVEFAAAWSEGQAMSLDRAVEYALGEE